MSSRQTSDADDAPEANARLVERSWAKDPKEVLRALGASEEGLTPEEAERRRERYGPNRLRRIKRRSVWSILWDQLKSLIMLLLVVAMVVSIFFGQTVEAAAIAAVIAINTAIGFFTEWRAVRSMEALQQMGAVEAVVVRGGRDERVPAEDLVPGDVVRLHEGDVVPADLRLVETDGIDVDESALTGESVPVAKRAEPVEADTPLAERASMVYKGTAVTRGSASSVVVRTGMHTELGEISAMVETAGQGQTPLEQKLQRLGRKLVWLTLGIAAAVAAAGIVAGRDTYRMIETAIALAVAAIPEGLPIVATVALAYGMRRMLHRNALIRRLSSVETLGATTLICTDKTGTLTENRMTVARLALPAGSVMVNPEADRTSAFTHDDETWAPDEHPALDEALRIAVLCNTASLSEDGEAQGDPMEVALLQLGRHAYRTRDELLDEMPQVGEVPFDRETKMMATVHARGDGYVFAVKGAPEAVLDACTHLRRDHGTEELDEETRRTWEERDDELAAEGLRVLALADKTVRNEGEDAYEGLRFLGYLGLLDPPRTDVRDVLDECRQAGIRLVMVTGDHPATARQVARAVGLATGDEVEVVEGRDFPNADDASEDDRTRLRRTAIFARVSPKQKLDLIDLHQAADEVVAMTGDGVNDAPALRCADIGVAMGRRGSDVAKEAADMVLQDDELSTIVAAIAQGRVIFANIRRFVVYLLSGNVGEILAVGAAATLGLALPLLPLQILYLNMINDVFPALALGVGPGAPHTMARPPRDPTEPVVTRYHWGLIGGYGLLIGATVLGAFLYALRVLGMTTTEAVTISFLSLSIGRLLHVFNMRSADSGVFRNEITKNRYIWLALGVSVVLLLVAVYVPFLASILEVTAPGLRHWLVIGAASLFPLLAGQLYLALRRRAGADSDIVSPSSEERTAKTEQETDRTAEKTERGEATRDDEQDDVPDEHGSSPGRAAVPSASDGASRAAVHEARARAHEERADAHLERAEAHAERALAEEARLQDRESDDGEHAREA